MKGYMLWLIILFFVACSFYFLFDSPSYVLFSFNSYTIETTLLSFILCFVLLFTLLYIIKSILLFFLRTIPSYCKDLTNNKKYVLNKFHDGIVYTLLGEWQTAYKYFSYVAKTNQKNFIYAISASILASKTKNYLEAKNWLTKNQEHCKADKHHDVINILLSKLYIKQEQYKQAYTILTKLNEKYPRNVVILPMLMNTLIYFKDWKHLLLLLPEIKKANILFANKYISFEHEVISGFFDNIIRQTDCNPSSHKDILLGKLNYNWDQLPNSYKKNPSYISIYVKSLIKASCNELAIKILENQLRNGVYNLDLISIYANLKVNNYATQLKILEIFENEFNHSYKLMFFLGKTSLNNKLLGKAFSYFEKSIALQKNVLAYKGIADVYLLENKLEQAIKYFNLAFDFIEKEVSCI